jgi:hypothetical protein
MDNIIIVHHSENNGLLGTNVLLWSIVVNSKSIQKYGDWTKLYLVVMLLTFELRYLIFHYFL